MRQWNKPTVDTLDIKLTAHIINASGSDLLSAADQQTVIGNNPNVTSMGSDPTS